MYVSGSQKIQRVNKLVKNNDNPYTKESFFFIVLSGVIRLWAIDFKSIEAKMKE